MKKKRKIGRKITGLLLLTVFLTMVLHGTVSSWSLHVMKKISMDASKELGQNAAEDSENALEDLACEQLHNIAIEKAEYIEEKFAEVSAYVNGISAMTAEIYENQQQYPDRDVPLPRIGNTKLSVQLLRASKLKDVSKEQQQELLKLGNVQDLLLQYNAHNDMVSSTYVATVSGWMIQADYIAYSKFSGQEEEPILYEADSRQWYQRALKALPGEIVYSDVIADVHEGGECIVYAQPIYYNDKIVAVAGVGSYLDTVNNTVLKTTIGEKGYAFLVNSNGQIMVSSMKEGETSANAEQNADLRKSKNTSLSKIAKKMVAGESGIEKLNIDEREVYLAYAPLKELEWSFVTIMDVEEVIAPAQESQDMIRRLTDIAGYRQDAAIQRMLFFFFVVTVFVAVFSSIFGAIFARKITKPIRKLTSDVKIIGEGNLDYKIQIATGDEIEDLGNGFNHMTAQIRRYITNLSDITEEKERIRTELTVASRLQADMLPESQDAFSDRTEFSLWAQMTAAREVGGDFYDFFLEDEDHLVFLVADVSGKGVPAALFMVVAKTLIRSRMKGKAGPAQVFQDTNDSLCENNGDVMFVTAWMGILTLSTGNLTYVNAGHNPPLIKRGRKEFNYLNQDSGFVLAGMEGMKYEQSQLQLMPGDSVFLYTDGVTEAHDANNQLYGEARLKHRLDDNSNLSTKEQIATVWQDVQSFKGNEEQFDDITMLALCYKGNGYQKNIGSPNVLRMEEIENFVEKVLKKGEVSKESLIKMQIAVDEIFSNICRYSKAKEVTIACKVTDGKIKIFFEDDGIPFNPMEKSNPDVTEELERRKVGGYGIYIVKQSMDSVTYEFTEGKNRLFLIKEARK